MMTGMQMPIFCGWCHAAEPGGGHSVCAQEAAATVKRLEVLEWQLHLVRALLGKGEPLMEGAAAREWWARMKEALGEGGND